MIQLTRDRTAVDAKFLDPDRKQNLVDLYRAASENMLDDDTTKKRVFNSSRWKKAKPQLETETFGKCAFCEAPTSAVYFGDVEHFRPKSVYWWLAYCYENFLYSCRVCNGKKSDIHNFSGPVAVAPAFAGTMDENALWALAQANVPLPTDAAEADALILNLSNEICHLPNPYEIDPKVLFAWEPDEVLREVRVVEFDASDASKRAVEAANQVVELNREELLLWRWRTYEHLVDLRDAADASSEPAKSMVLDIIRKLTLPEAPFSAMTWHFAHREWGII